MDMTCQDGRGRFRPGYWHTAPMSRFRTATAALCALVALCACQARAAHPRAATTSATSTEAPFLDATALPPRLAPPTTHVPTTRQCTGQDLRVEANGGDGGGGHDIYWLFAKNVGHGGCTLAGRPTLLIGGRDHPDWRYAGSWFPEQKFPARLQPDQVAVAVISTVPGCEYPKRLWPSPHRYTDFSVVVPGGKAVPVSLDFSSCYVFGVSRWFTEN